MEETKFWFRILGLVVVVSLILACSLTGYYTYKAKLIKDMVVKGADPVAAHCAISFDSYAICALLAK